MTKEEEKSAFIKQIVKNIASLFPCEWDEALEELEKRQNLESPPHD